MRVITLISLYVVLNLVLCIPAANAQLQPDTIGQETMSAPAENWFISKTGAGAYIYDGLSGEMQGMLSLAGFDAPSVQAYGPRREFYAAESYYSRRVRGDRTDVVTIYDYENLSPVAEIEIPKKIAVLSFAGHLGLTGNGRHLIVFNMTPAQSVSIVDVENRNFVGELSTPGCAIIMPTGEDDFLMICGDGTLQLIQLDQSGEEANRVRSEQFFVVEEDAVYDRPVRTEDGWLLISHAGKAFDVTRDGTQIMISEWSILSDADVEEKWLPGGGQLKTVHQNLGLLYILMHQGGEFTHHEPGTEIWVFDVNQRRRIARIELEVAARNVMVTQESEPKLIVSDTEGGLHVYDARQMKLERTIEDPGPSTSLLVDF
ncbi:MAG: methylamine utilization protein MauE [Gammaproteobacteria bacterium]|nr:MAG: methylamine utilization protein MauE [Gammaproteobacteria bacterium]RLA36803.1 MAG: methylamine utilization protein MauE [Gammaproteobacteria bacterium]